LITPEKWPGTLTGKQKDLLDALSDVVLPMEGNGPDPSALRISDFFDDWLSAPYDLQVKDRAIIEPGLVLIDLLSVALFWRRFVHLSRGRQMVIVSLIKCTSSVFLNRFAYLLVGGYFTSSAGNIAIGYQGNVPLMSFPQISSDLGEKVEARLRELGL
jgi:hypothetical protein